jgi:hypothetical protein
VGVVGACVVGSYVVGASVVGAYVEGGTAVGASDVGATVRGAAVVGVSVVGAPVGAELEGAAEGGACVQLPAPIHVELTNPASQHVNEPKVSKQYCQPGHGYTLRAHSSTLAHSPLLSRANPVSHTQV